MTPFLLLPFVVKMSVVADEDRLTSREVLYVADKKARGEPCCSTLKVRGHHQYHQQQQPAVG